MHLLTESAAIDWCRNQAPALARTLLPTERAVVGGVRGIRVPIVGSPIEVLGLSYVLIMTDVAGDDEARFAGGLILLQDWDIWSGGIEQVGHTLLGGLRMQVARAPSGSSPTVRDAPGHLVDAEEFVIARSMIALPMLFQWDALYMPAHGRLIAEFSHHGFVDLVVLGEAHEESLYSRFGGERAAISRLREIGRTA